MLGPFELDQQIGQGGMGTVWSGRHMGTGQPVAVKVLRGELAGDRVYVEGFHREVRSIARLDHPGIVQVFDHGVISKEAALRWPEVEAGSLWLAMEFAAGGSLDDHPHRWRWTELRGLFLAVLDALAHAHARGLVHRDLKPANLLLLGDGDGGQGWVLSDFGLAHMRDPRVNSNTGDVDSASAGTPYFMAPEQFHGLWRDFGPWTDLYSLGAMAYFLVARRPLFDGASPMAIGIKHITEPVPRLKPAVAVPHGFENWLRRLLAKEIRHRYQRAADAAADLAILDDVAEPEAADPGEPLELSDAETLAAGTTLGNLGESIVLQTQRLDEEALRQRLAADRRGDQGPITARDLQPVRRVIQAASWEHTERIRRPRNIPGTGKGVFAVRQAPYVGRHEARDHLWGELNAVCDDGRARLVVIRGAPGLGKTRLMEWVAIRAHELGVASALTVSHSPIMNPTDGLPHAFQTLHGASGLGRSELMDRLRHSYTTYFGDPDPDDAHLAALVEWMHPRPTDSDDGLPVVQLESPLERYLLAERALRHFTEQRPVILNIDDGQWAQDSLGFARHLLSNREEFPLPVLMVVTLRADSLQGRLVERDLLERLEASPASSAIEIAPMGEDEQRRLVTSLLGLEPELVDEIGRVSRGNPFFAIQVVEDWVGRDVLDATPRGYRLAAGEEIPGDLETLLERRIEEIAAGWQAPQKARVAMEAAAALGVDVDDREWRAVCAALEVDVDQRLLNHFMVQGLAVPHALGWRFRLRLYRDALEAVSRRHRRWASVHRAVAATIDTAVQNGTCLAERRARHLLAAGALEEAVPLLQNALQARREKGAYLQAHALIDLLEEIYEQLGRSASAPCRLQLLIPRSECNRFLGRGEAAEELLEEVRQRLDNLPLAQRAEARRALGSFHAHGGGLEEGLLHYQRARELFEEVGDERGLAKTLDGLGWVYRRINDVHRAMEAYEAGRAVARGAGLRLEEAWCLIGMADPTLHDADFAGEGLARQALKTFEATGCRSGQAVAHWLLGDYRRLRGELDEARELYRRMRHLANMVGHHTASQSAIALFGICDLEERRLDDAQERFEQFIAEMQATRSQHFSAPMGYVGLLAVAALRGDHEAFDELAPRLGEHLAIPNIIRRDLRRVLDHAAAGWQARDDVERVEVVWALKEVIPGGVDH